MIRYVLTAAAVAALLSGAAVAQPMSDDVGSKTVITRGAPDGTGMKRTVIKRHVNRYGELVTKHKTIREGLSGSSVTKTRRATDPLTGETTIRSRTELR